jgi:16S rRNA (cytidine1402-2'-O)-methyltransferase
MDNESGTLFIVATPIGNIGDITKRAIETLTDVDIVACEDSRNTGKLLKLLGIEKKHLVSLHQHSNDEVIERLIDQLLLGSSVAYVTDGGTPNISDPGLKLIQNVKLKSQNDNSKIKIIPIPGPSAVASAVSVSGMVEKEFYFAGFLPKKKGRVTKFKELSTLNIPIVIYESALRLPRTLNDIKEYFGENTEVFIAREMTKMFEEYWGGGIDAIIKTLGEHKLKGEVTLILKKLT